ncbi:unnamed protein product [Mycena citricolor]|uniref:Cleavage/polyadenylation specificity factor A subunit C-terminal domain-containing protein n=1 Tax=Mycena citricolor TaxID=2018698 RepID=A0AAD2H5D1_9AGAR|nr:unnamed protein product [Mycena citricolor]
MHALYQEILPASGVQFVTALKLTPSTQSDSRTGISASSSRRTLCNLVVARCNVLRIFEVCEEMVPAENLDKGDEMDQGVESKSITRIYFVREHSLHGIVTGIQAIQVLASLEDHLDRLIISFKDAKIALMEWSEAVHDLVTVSIHTYERAPQLMSLDASYQSMLRVDPDSRCAVLSLPKDALAILPFYQSQVDLDMEQDQVQARDIPYSPSFILDLPVSVEESVQHVIDFVFLPGYNHPTMAVLFQTQQTWTGRLKEYKDTVKLVVFTLDVVGQHYPVISSVSGLPHDCFSLVACPTALGGVVILATNSIIYVERSSRRVVLPLNGWASRISEMPLPSLLTQEEQTRDMALEGSRALFVDDKTLYLFLKDGNLYPIEFLSDGKLISKLAISVPLAQTTVPQITCKVDSDHFFVGSLVGPSVLLNVSRVEEELEDDIEMGAPQKEEAAMEIYEDDEDIYGPSRTVDHIETKAVKKTKTVTRLSLVDTIDAYGPISDMAFSVAWNGDRPVPELVAATGSGTLGGFTLFQRDLPIRTKRKLHALGGARGIWSLPIRSKSNASSSEYDTLVISTDANPSPGLSRISYRAGISDISVSARISGITIGAGAFFARTAILHVTTNSIRVLEPDGAERQIIKDMDANMPRPKIRACSILDPYAIVIREDDSIGMFIETDKGRIRRKDMSSMGDKSSRYLTASFFADTTGLFDNCFVNNGDSAEKVDKTATPSRWLILVRPQGVVEIWTLPKLTLVFSTPLLANLESVLTDTHVAPTASPPQNPARQPEELDIEQIMIAPLGEVALKPHLFVFLRSGHLAVYEVVEGAVPEERPTVRAQSLNLKFVKVSARAFEIQRTSETGIIAEQKRILRQFLPFTTLRPSGEPISGVFFTGDRPSWILATDKSAVKIIPSGHSVVHAFSPTSLWDSRGDFLLYSEEGPCLVEWMADYSFEYHLPSRTIPRGRSYSNVVFDSSTYLIVAASSLYSAFTSFDEDMNRIWEPDAPNVSDPVCETSCLELISPDYWITMDGFEFATNEFITALECVTLETSSTESGKKDFIAVGTTINRGEDLAVKGCTYIFEIVEVVADPALAPKRWHKLRLRFKDDTKGPVTALCGFNGYLVSSMGQKIFVRAFDDDRLVGVAFLDVGVYVTSLRTLKNFLLIGDAVKSITFVAFQEDPYKLVILGKDLARVCVTTGDFFFAEYEMSLLTSDEDGIIRIYEYSPNDPGSRDGRYLLLRSEFHGQSEYRTSSLVAHRANEEADIPQSRIIYGSTDGSLRSLTPSDESSAKRLQLLQGQLTRNIQHVAGLNPRAFRCVSSLSWITVCGDVWILRIVRNEFVSKPLSKGILDGNLLVHYENLPISRQNEMTRQIGTERGQILRDWTTLTGPCW